MKHLLENVQKYKAYSIKFCVFVTFLLCKYFSISFGSMLTKNYSSVSSSKPIIHFLNIDKAVDRKEFMMNQFSILGFESLRLRSFLEEDVSMTSIAFVPDCNNCHRDKESCNKHFLGKIIPRVWSNQSITTNRSAIDIESKYILKRIEFSVGFMC